MSSMHELTNLRESAAVLEKYAALSSSLSLSLSPFLLSPSPLSFCLPVSLCPFFLSPSPLLTSSLPLPFFPVSLSPAPLSSCLPLSITRRQTFQVCAD